MMLRLGIYGATENSDGGVGSEGAEKGGVEEGKRFLSNILISWMLKSVCQLGHRILFWWYPRCSSLSQHEASS